MDLPLNQSGFDFEFTTEFGKKYEGHFTVLCVLSMRAKHQLELEKTRLLGNNVAPTDELAGIAVILATLHHKVVDGPEWWKQSDGGFNIEDIDVLTKLYSQVQETEASWRAKLKEQAKKLLPPPTTTSP